MRTVLVSSFTLSPTRGSEFSVGWNYIRELGKDNKLIVLYGTSTGEFEEFEDFLPFLSKEMINNIEFIPVRVLNKSLFIKFCYFLKIKGIKIVPYYFIYRNWQKRTYNKASEIILNKKVDVIHYLNPIGFKEPGFLWKLDIPYIWGPVKGVDSRPFRLLKNMNFKQLLTSSFRNVILDITLRFSLRVKQAISNADVVIASTTSTEKQFKKLFNKECMHLPENGILELENNINIVKEKDENIRLVWVGRLDFNKALIILIEALNIISNEKWELHVVGSGKLENHLKKTSIQKGINERVIWHGQVTRDQVQSIINNSHLHVITSLGEGNPTTIWETMAKGIPTLSIDHCGMKDTICEKCGIKISIQSYNQVIHDIAKNIKLLIDNPQEINRLSKGTLQCAHKYTWDKRRDFFNKQYEVAISNYKERSTKGHL